MVKIKESYTCALELAMALAGGKWKMVILWHLREGTVLRFTELKRLIPGITQKMLTQQLRELEEARLLSRTVYAVVPPRVEYAQTEQGTKLSPILNDLCLWSHDYAQEFGLLTEKKPCPLGGQSVSSTIEQSVEGE